MIYCVKNRYPEVLVSVVLAGLLHQSAQIDAHAFKYSIGVEGFFVFLSLPLRRRGKDVCAVPWQHVAQLRSHRWLAAHWLSQLCLSL